jgi:GT2 family glycosyltransferase
MDFVPESPLAIIIPVYNGLSYTARTLPLLRRLEGPAATVVVVDDGSTDGTAAFLARDWPDVVRLQGTGSLWWSGAVDLGCRTAIDRGARILVLWNNDNVDASLDCIIELAKAVEVGDGCAVPVVLGEENGGRRPIISAGGEVDWLRGGLRLREIGRPYEPSPTSRECEWLPGMALTFSSNLFRTLGGFDLRFPQYRGDSDFTMRARTAGFSCRVLYSCWVANDPRQTGMAFTKRISLKEFARGLVTLKSNYHLPTTVRFALRHCPPYYVPISLGIFYLKYLYATMKTWRGVTGEIDDRTPA